MTKEPKYYAVGDKEILYATNIDEAVIEFIDGLYKDEEIPEFVEVRGYAPLQVKDCSFDYCLEYLLENLDESYGSPDEFGDYELSPKAKELFELFKQQVKQEYPVWGCEEVGDPIKIKVSDIDYD